MARRLIGLDIGTNAVTVAEVTAGAPPRLNVFGQVALPRDAMREGEVVDDLAVTDAIARLRSEVDLRRASVRVGIASPRLIVRQVEMPVMSHDDLASALRFQAQELIPIPIEEAVLDFAVLGTHTPDDGEPVMRVLLAAAQEATIARLVGAIEAAGLPVAAVDLVPLALIRALARPVSGDGIGAEGIVSFGGGVTAIAVHEAGVPRFVRVLGTGGRELTDAIATELEIPPETAESLKRQLATGGDDLVARARGAVDRPLAAMLDEVRSSLDYYRNQPGAARLLRVVITGGASQLPGLGDRLAALVGVPVEHARPREVLEIGDIGFTEDEYPRLDPYLAASVGLALGGAGIGTVIDLLPRARRRGATPRSRMVVGGAIGAAALVALLALPTMQRRSTLSDRKDEKKTLEAANAEVQRKIDALADAAAKSQQLDLTRAQLASLLTTDVSWARMLNEIAHTIPDDVWLTSFAGQVTAAAPERSTRNTTTSAGAATGPLTPAGALTGTVNFEGVGLSYPSVADWIRRISENPSFSGLWVPNATLGDFADTEVVNFTSSAQMTASARSDRLDEFLVGEE